MMGATTPDGLPWPEYADPAAVPQDMQELAAAVQAALNVRPVGTPVTTALTLEPGWVNNVTSYGGFVLYRVGRIVVARGLLMRSTNLAVADNTTYKMATIPVGFRPAYSLRPPAAWVATVTGGVHNYMATQLDILADGSVSLVSNVAGTITAGSDFVSLGGLSWVTP